MQQIALETQGVIDELRLLLDDAVAGDDGFLQGAALNLLVDLAQHMFFVDGPDQPGLQLLGGKRLDQVVVRRQFGQRHDIGVAALAGDDHVHRRQRDEVGVAQFFQQLLAVAAIVEDKIGEHDVEAVGLDLADDLGRVARAMHQCDAQGSEHQAQRIARRRMAVNDQDPFLGQRLVQNQQHLLVIELAGPFGLACTHFANLLEFAGQGKESAKTCDISAP